MGARQHQQVADLAVQPIGVDEGMDHQVRAVRLGILLVVVMPGDAVAASIVAGRMQVVEGESGRHQLPKQTHQARIGDQKAMFRQGERQLPARHVPVDLLPQAGADLPWKEGRQDDEAIGCEAGQHRPGQQLRGRQGRASCPASVKTRSAMMVMIASWRWFAADARGRHACR